MRTFLTLTLASGLALAQTGLPDSVLARLNTEERVRLSKTLTEFKPQEPYFQSLLAKSLIQKTRDTQDFRYLDRASRILQEVLAGDGTNYEALRLRSQIHLERHEFREAAGNARRLIEREPMDPYNYGALGDALIELGDDDAAGDAYQRMVNLSPDLSSYNRAAYYRFLLGDAPGAIEVMKRAVAAGSLAEPEPLAWCLAQLGDLYLKQGETRPAEAAFAEALRVFPNHQESLAGMGRAAAAQGRFDGAIDWMKRSVAAAPVIDHVALLADYYTAAGKKGEADKQWKLVEFLDKLAEANKQIHNRNLAMVYLNHDMHLEKALQLALRELEVRGDIYTWDAVAWAFHKNGKHLEAAEAMKKALRLGTADPMLQHHASVIQEFLPVGGSR